MSVEETWAQEEARHQAELEKRRAYYRRRYESDPEYRERMRANARRWAADNREEKNRRNREHMRRVRAEAKMLSTRTIR